MVACSVGHCKSNQCDMNGNETIDLFKLLTTKKMSQKCGINGHKDREKCGVSGK